MGMFDYVRVERDDFTCSEGHNLRGEEFQSKSFECSLSTATIGERLIWTPGSYGEPMAKPFLGRVVVYAGCSRCEVQRPGGRHFEQWCEFEVEIVDDVVRSVRRVSGTLAEQLVEQDRIDERIREMRRSEDEHEGRRVPSQAHRREASKRKAPR